MSTKVVLHRSMWRGAKIGAIICGLAGFSSGVGVCIAYRLPVPPLFVTEIGIVLGGCLGAMMGWASNFHLGRQLMRGVLLGLLAGAAFALVAPAGLRALALAAPLGLGIFLGYQAGLVEPQSNAAWLMRPRTRDPG